MAEVEKSILNCLQSHDGSKTMQNQLVICGFHNYDTLIFGVTMTVVVFIYTGIIREEIARTLGTCSKVMGFGEKYSPIETLVIVDTAKSFSVSQNFASNEPWCMKFGGVVHVTCASDMERK
jgi:hypothetical protein